jgi:hypothetical protein
MNEAIKFGIVSNFSRISLIELQTTAMTFPTQINNSGGKDGMQKVR